MNLDKRLLQQTRVARLDLVLTVGLGVLTSILVVGQAYYLSRVINRVFLLGDSLGEVQSLLLVLLVLALARASLTWGAEITARRVTGRVKSELRERLTAHLFVLGPAYTRTERSGELTNTIVEGVEALDAYLSQYLPQLAMAALIPVTILIFVFPLDLLSGLVLLLTAPLIPLFIVLIGGAARELTRRQWTALSRMSAHFLDVLQGLTTLKLLGRSREQVQLIGQISQRFGQTTLGVLKVAFLSSLALEMVATLSTAVVAVEIGLRLLYGRLLFEQALTILILAPEFYLPLRQLGASFHAGMSGVEAAQRIFEILETPLSLPTALPGRRAPGRQTTTPAALRFDIRFTNVYYSFDGGQRPALNNFSTHISPGQRVALVGPTGAGKSTVTHLLLRFVEPDSGQITVDGIPLPELDITAWRKQLAWVPQNPHLFHASIADNIRLARPEASLAEITQATRQAHIHAFIKSLPQGYDTLVGEHGARLSGGQAQRIALARAFLKDAPFLILDEATANLDPEHETLLQEVMKHLTSGRTVLLIAHRLNTVYDADKILVMNNGRVVESGNHASLLRQGGLYRNLVTAYRSP